MFGFEVNVQHIYIKLLLSITNKNLWNSNNFRQRSETEEILDSILPPREWEEDGQLWRQSVSSTPATRLDVINLQVIPETIIS